PYAMYARPHPDPVNVDPSLAGVRGETPLRLVRLPAASALSDNRRKEGHVVLRDWHRARHHTKPSGRPWPIWRLQRRDARILPCGARGFLGPHGATYPVAAGRPGLGSRIRIWRRYNDRNLR